MEQLKKKRPLNAFQKGTRNFTFMMLGFMGIMVPIVSTFLALPSSPVLRLVGVGR